ELYQSDESHPSLAGSYAAACCFYSSIFRTDPTQIKSDYGLNALEAVVIRNAVKTVFYDQMNNWNIGINTLIANFEYLHVDSVTEIFGRKVRFKSLNDSAVGYKWYFGDGDSSLLQTKEHVYKCYGNWTHYTVTHIVYESCTNDTISKIITVFNMNGIDDLFKEPYAIKLIPNPASQQINLISETYNFSRNKIIVRDILGRQVMEESINTQSNQVNLGLNLNVGTYFINVTDADGAMVYHGKFIVIH
ncbi:MAG: T9SS type A sorting domain-containing protein, partial [Bacteroidota bacterium]|nr:T9SS type A sorting domain-containing protein [Bacteroidota bacterium]